MHSSKLSAAEVFRTLHPKDFLRKFIEKGVRPDNRNLLEFRMPTIKTNVISTCESSAIVKLGDTSVLCGIRVEVAQPRWDRPDSGYLGRWNVKDPDLLEKEREHAPGMNVPNFWRLE
jgi:exosome complex RNA-binding protein Rrp42 (RNase PH superfamily)